MLSHLPVLQVIVPLMAAPACLLLRQARLVWMFATIVCALAFLISFQLLYQVQAHGELIYELGGWQAPIGIEYRVDALTAMMLVLVSAIATVVMMGAHTSIKKELHESKHTLFYIAFLLCFAGSLGIIATGDAFNVFVFLEVSSLSTYTLIALGNDRRALWASYQYLIMGTIGATFILIGIGLMYMMTGTLNMADMAQRLPAVNSTLTIFSAFAFFIVGVCLKLALFPLHLWLPNAYAYAPSIVTAFLAATSTKVAIYVLLRFIFTIFGVEFSLSHLPLPQILMGLGLIGVVGASIVAILQTNVKRLFAYSSVAQIGYMILGFSLGSQAGLKAALLHVFNHALMKGAIFMAIAGVVYHASAGKGSANLTAFKGLGKRMPITMAAIVVGGLSLIGVPLTVGFISKWYLIVALMDQGLWPVVALVLFGSLLAVVYVWKIVEYAYFHLPEDGNDKFDEAPMSLLIPTWLLVVANIYFGVNTEFTVNIADLAVFSLFGATP
ncbi:MAG: monovalent cation/H+ antiporter subunit D family protein [Agarilytica sp.]